MAADQAKPGEALYTVKTHVNDNVRHEYHVIKASLTGQANADEHAWISSENSAASDTHLAGEDVGDSDNGAAGGTTTQAHGSLRVRADADASVKALDNAVEGDGAVHVNVY